MSVKIHIRVVGETHAGCSAPLLYWLRQNVEVSVRELTLTIVLCPTSLPLRTHDAYLLRHHVY